LTVVERAAAAGHVRVTERPLSPPRPVAPPVPAPKPLPKPVAKKTSPAENIRLAGARQEIGRLFGPSIPVEEPSVPPLETPAPIPESQTAPEAVEARGEPEAPEAAREEPELIERIPVRYPPSAAEEGVTGTVHLKIVVGLTGRVETALVVRSSGDARLDAAATRSALRWRYRPARRDGEPVPSVVYAAVEFSLSDDRPRDNE
jgi:protein TonB